MAQDLWGKEVENTALKPLDEWRNDLYGYWMVFSDVIYEGGEKLAIARYYIYQVRILNFGIVKE